MLWNGVSSTPRLRPTGAGSPRAPRRRPRPRRRRRAAVGRTSTPRGSRAAARARAGRARAITPATPSVNRSASGYGDREVLLAQAGRERRPDRRQGERVGGQGAADPGDVDLVAEHRARRAGRRSPRVMPYAADGTPPPIGLPTTTKSGSRPQARGAPARPGAQRVRLVDDQQHAVATGDLADAVEVAVVGQHDADVGQRRLHQQAGDVALGQPPVEGVEVVERHHGRRDGDVDLRTEGAGPGHHPVAVEHGEGLVDGAVVAPVHHRDPRPAGEVPGEPQHEPVGVGGRHRQLPGRQPEPAGQLLADPDRVLRTAASW